MSPPPVDRRVRRTRGRLKEALLELMHERGYEGLTVREIADRADVGRSTFYDHFESKEDLLFAGVEEHLAAMTGDPEGPGGPGADRGPGVESGPDADRGPDGAPVFRFSLRLLLHVRLQRRFFETAVLGGSDPRLREISEEILTQVVATELERMAPGLPSRASAWPGATPGEIRRGHARAVVGAFMGLLDWWLRRADHLPAEAVDAIFQRCARSLARDDPSPAPLP